MAVNALGNAEILQYPKYKLNLYVVAVCFVAASGGLLFGARCRLFVGAPNDAPAVMHSGHVADVVALG